MITCTTKLCNNTSQYIKTKLFPKYTIFCTVGVSASLKSLLKDPDATVRHKATEVLSIIAGGIPYKIHVRDESGGWRFSLAISKNVLMLSYLIQLLT